MFNDCWNYLIRFDDLGINIDETIDLLRENHQILSNTLKNIETTNKNEKYINSKVY